MCRRVTTTGISIGLLCGCALVFWLIMGSNFSDVPPYPYLAHGPTDECSVYGNSTDARIENTLEYYYSNVSTMSLTDVPFSRASASSPAPMETVGSTSLLHTIYSISYILFSFIGFCTTICVGLAASLCTKRQDTFDERCLLSFRKHVINNLFTRSHAGCENNGKRKDCHEDVNFLSTEIEF
jgi:hypothetical protein